MKILPDTKKTYFEIFLGREQCQYKGAYAKVFPVSADSWEEAVQIIKENLPPDLVKKEIFYRYSKIYWLRLFPASCFQEIKIQAIAETVGGKGIEGDIQRIAYAIRLTRPTDRTKKAFRWFLNSQSGEWWFHPCGIVDGYKKEIIQEWEVFLESFPFQDVPTAAIGRSHTRDELVCEWIEWQIDYKNPPIPSEQWGAAETCKPQPFKRGVPPLKWLRFN